MRLKGSGRIISSGTIGLDDLITPGSMKTTLLTWMGFRDRHDNQLEHKALLAIRYYHAAITALKAGVLTEDRREEKHRIREAIKRLQLCQGGYKTDSRPRKENRGRPRGKTRRGDTAFRGIRKRVRSPGSSPEKSQVLRRVRARRPQ